MVPDDDTQISLAVIAKRSKIFFGSLSILPRWTRPLLWMSVPQANCVSFAPIFNVASFRRSANIWVVTVSTATVFRVRPYNRINQKTRGVRCRRVDFASRFSLIPFSLRVTVHVPKRFFGKQDVTCPVRRKKSTTSHINGRSIVTPTCCSAPAAQSRYVNFGHCLSKN
ncbi:hypothetical protein D3C72_1292430 [compost metagenome]